MTLIVNDLKPEQILNRHVSLTRDTATIEFREAVSGQAVVEAVRRMIARFNKNSNGNCDLHEIPLKPRAIDSALLVFFTSGEPRSDVIFGADANNPFLEPNAQYKSVTLLMAEWTQTRPRYMVGHGPAWPEARLTLVGEALEEALTGA